MVAQRAQKKRAVEKLLFFCAPNETFFEPIIPRRLGQDLGVEVLDTQPQ